MGQAVLAVLTAMATSPATVEVSTVTPQWQPGAAVYALVTLKPSEGWHTYWLNPGDSGVATRIDWQLPPGWTAQPPLMALPKRIGDSDLMNFGFYGDTDMVVKLVPPRRSTNAPVDVKASVRWMACLDQCVAYETPIQLRLQPGQGAPRNEATAQRIRKVLDAQPISLPGITVSRSALGYLIRGTGDANPIDFIASDNQSTRHTQAPVVGRTQTGWSLDVPISEYLNRPPRRLQGVLVLESNATRRAIRIDHPVADAASGERQ